MSRWKGYIAPLVVIALSAFVSWCAWPPARVTASDAREPESRVIHHLRIGDVLFHKGKIEEAAVEYHRANLASPNHPQARAGLARVAAARGHYSRALELYGSLMDEGPTPEVARAIDDILLLTRRSPAGPVPAPQNGSRSQASAPFPEAPAGQ
jgi:tetratricopeptide (TPR) repeat protein